MAGFRIVGDASGNSTDVSADHNLRLRLANGTSAQGGYAAMGSVRVYSDSAGGGGAFDNAQVLPAPSVSDDFRLRVGRGHPLDNEVFCYTSQNTGKFFYAFTTMTMAQSAFNLVTNSGSIVTANTGCIFRTFRMFPLFGTTGSAKLDIEGAFSAKPAINTVLDFGMFLPGAANPFAPTDGVYFRVNSAGIFGVVCYGGVEYATPVFSINPDLLYHSYHLVFDQKGVEFFIDEVRYAVLPAQKFAATLYQAWELPFAIRHAIITNAASNAFQFKVANYAIESHDIASNRSWAERMASWGGAYQGQSGQTMGSTASYANSSNGSTATALNTSAAAGTTGLGGIVTLTNTDLGTVTTDTIANSYQVPVGTVTSPGKSLFVKGAWVSAESSGATATAGATVWFAVAFGSTAANLATTESASFASGTAKAPRIVPLGYMSVPAGSIVGTQYTPARIYVPFATPIVVNQGEFLILLMKCICNGGVTSQTIVVTNGYDHYWE